MDIFDETEELGPEIPEEPAPPPEEPTPLEKLKAELISEFPRMTAAGATRLIGYVEELFMDRLKSQEAFDKWRSTFEMRVFEAVSTSGLTSFESYSENGLSVVLDKDAILRGITPVASVIPR